MKLLIVEKNNFKGVKKSQVIGLDTLVMSRIVSKNTCPFVLPTSSISAFFLYYKAGKCSSQPVGKNTMGKIPSVVASYLKLPDVACYTGHCLRRSSATLLADAGVDITTIKRHAGWKSTTVAEGYVENSIENKTKIANQVLLPTHGILSTLP
ncbi:hypothetical protein NQ317_003921 [Molorchus minor]|uniref:Tyr recombinase domain-containing protein n=1 Tax=Molorchus minor TaxID=1323400 RepID=A0ABQ9J8D1_9CUCU|nr:hypothetical protein NQ317_003921 [Molorchus minor]